MNRLNRRRFLTWIKLGWLSSISLALIAACTRRQQGAESNLRSDGFQAAGNVNESNQLLDKIQVQVGSIPIVVLPNPSQPEALIALNSTCPHAGCKVNWKESDRKFVCPCHDSEFAPSGQVLRGPAVKPLASYPVKIENRSILVKLS